MELRWHGALKNARKAHGQQDIPSPATSRERGFLTEKLHRQGRNILLHDNARPHVTEVVKAVL